MTKQQKKDFPNPSTKKQLNYQIIFFLKGEEESSKRSTTVESFFGEHHVLPKEGSVGDVFSRWKELENSHSKKKYKLSKTSKILKINQVPKR